MGQELRDIIQPNTSKCLSKIGVTISSGFHALSTVEMGDITVLDRHEKRQKKMVKKDKFREETLKEQGRLAAIKSDLARTLKDPNSIKDSLIVNE